ALHTKMHQDDAKEEQLIAEFETQIINALRTIDLKITAPMQQQLSEHLHQLQQQMSIHYQDLNQSLEKFQQKIQMLHQALSKEEEKTTLMSRRFDTLEELLAFEVELGQLPQKSIEVPEACHSEHSEGS